ncbi:S8 family peptidase [Actinoplanes sp. NPDC051494]|uniref:S8 family peptidase n=1 Tax=Actinoplanes sp. NPDC051494 TaxID=3363907 RepID=UPI0037A450CE
MRELLSRPALALLAVATIGGVTTVNGSAAYASDGLLPAEVSGRQPARVVSTTLDATGRPVISTRTATDRTTAARYLRDARRAPRTVAVELDTRAHAAAVPAGTDPYRADQWDFATIGVTRAWEHSTGAGVIVAVIDTGVDATHPDLAGAILPGIDYLTGTTGTSSDPNGHGTHVAGTIAALTGNDVGISAIAPDTKILPIRALDAKGSGNMADVANGIVYAADHGADVINMSLGATTEIAAMTNAIAYARDKGVTVVAAAGNDGEKGSPVAYPAADPGVIAVAATDTADRVASFSNRGDYIDIAAPGYQTLSTYPTDNGSYAIDSGTSMASPHVAAVAALIKAYRPAATPDQIETILEDSAVDLGATGKDTGYGWGRVDAAAALDLTADGSTAPSTTAITVGAGALTVLYGTRITTRYAVTIDGSPAADRAAQVCTATATSAFTCTAATTTADGTVTVAATATGARRIRLTVPATATASSAVSPVTTYTVRTQVAATRGTARTLKVTLTGAAGQLVRVQRWTTGGWRQVTSYRATRSHTVTGLVTGARYRVVVPATTTLTGATSPTVTA